MTDTNHQNSTDKRLLFDGREQAAQLVLSLAQKAHRQICILGSNIDHALFDQQEFVTCVSDLARRSPKTEIKIIVHDTSLNMQHDHRLIELSQRLTSSIHIRNTARQHRDLQQTLLLVDDFGYLLCPRSTRYEGRCHFNDRLETRNLQALFDDVWQSGSPDSSLRRLSV